MSGDGRPALEIPDATGLTLAIAAIRWHGEITDVLLERALATAVKAGVESRKLHTLAGWRDSRFFDAREGAALAWAEQLTTLPSGAPADATYEALKAHFDEHGIAELTMAVATINAWNRLGVGMQPVLP